MRADIELDVLAAELHDLRADYNSLLQVAREYRRQLDVIRENLEAEVREQ